ncbi:hypothetical protein B0H11DRAFT_2253747 [Mycena galericulata]|nr:hypothetical protein B0H11DRAFT_2253747 [Mycena galericulata]
MSLSIHPIGDVGAVETSSGNTRLYYQTKDGDIQEAELTGPFVQGILTRVSPLVRCELVIPGSPIAACAAQDLSSVYVFFVAPGNILSQYYYQNGKWEGGHNGLSEYKIQVKPGTKLYAMFNPPNSLRVGYTTPSGVLGEADYSDGQGGWATDLVHM